MGTVHCGLRRVALDDAFAGGHLGAVGVGDVGLEFLALAVQAGSSSRYELSRTVSFLAQSFDAGLAFGVLGSFLGGAVLALVQADDLVGRLVQAPGAVQQFGVGTATLLAGVAGKFDAVDGEHIASDEALRVAGHEYLTEQRLDLFAQATDELGDVGVAGLAVATDGDELDVAGTGAFYRPAGDDAMAVGQQYHLEHDARVVGTGAYLVVVESRIQCAEVQFVVDQVVQCEGEAARFDLFTQHYRQHQAVALLGLVAGHGFYGFCGDLATTVGIDQTMT